VPLDDHVRPVAHTRSAPGHRTYTQRVITRRPFLAFSTLDGDSGRSAPRILLSHGTGSPDSIGSRHATLRAATGLLVRMITIIHSCGLCKTRRLRCTFDVRRSPDGLAGKALEPLSIP
jgi:hypothetical protein